MKQECADVGDTTSTMKVAVVMSSFIIAEM